MASGTSGRSPTGQLQPLAEPIVLGRYELIAPLGSGGMATVYFGRVLDAGGFERHVAIKVCHAHLRQDPKFVDLFLKEARVAARLHTPHVVPTLDVRDEEELYLVMEYVEGGSLGDLLDAARKRDECLPIPVVLRIVRDALSGLHTAHGLTSTDGRHLNLIHRDVSPHNLLVGTDGVTRVADFGVARIEEQTDATLSGGLKGKVAYMSPEQLRQQPLTQRADLFAIGIVLWESLTGRRLFKGPNDVQSMANVLSAPIHRPSRYRADLSPSVDALVKRCLERSPDKRFGTAHEILEALKAQGGSLATPEEVGALVSELLSEPLEASRAVRKGATAVLTKTASPAEGASASWSGSPSFTGSVTAPIAEPTVAMAWRPPARRNRAALVIAVLLLVAGALLGGLVLGGRDDEPTNVAGHYGGDSGAAEASITPASDADSSTPAKTPTTPMGNPLDAGAGDDADVRDTAPPPRRRRGGRKGPRRPAKQEPEPQGTEYQPQSI